MMRMQDDIDVKMAVDYYTRKNNKEYLRELDEP